MTLIELRDRVEAALRDFLLDRRAQLTAIDPELATLASAIEGLVLGGGKRLRPAFAYWGCRAIPTPASSPHTYFSCH